MISFSLFSLSNAAQIYALMYCEDNEEGTCINWAKDSALALLSGMLSALDVGEDENEVLDDNSWSISGIGCVL